jgi:CubicO group peptidase (beta-lactamase class C family)
MKHLLKITVFLIFITQTIFAQSAFIKDSIDIYIKREMTRWNLPGMAIAIVKDGKVVFMKGYGYSNINTKTPVTENTVFQIASNSKAFTGTSLALLENYGKLKLDDKVKSYLPYFKMNEDWKTNEVSIADVLSHRIGYGTFQSDLLNWGGTKSRKELIENMANVTPKYGLRENYGYCNMGFLTAGEIIPAVCDTSWDDFLKYHFFNPLEMVNTKTKYIDFINSDKASKAYTLVNYKIQEITPANVDNLGPAGSITSNVNDLSKWVIMQLNNGKYNGKQIMPEAVINRTRESFTIVEKKSRKGKNFGTYGLGWFLNDAYGKKIVTHDGGANGFLSKTVLVPEENFGFVILTNSDAQYLFEALGTQLINDLTQQPYVNLSPLYYYGFKEDYDEEIETKNKLNKTALNFKPAKDAYTKLSGIYSNKVYGKIAIESKGTYAEVTFEFHPQYKGKLNYLTNNTLVIEYNDPTLGTKEIRFSNTEQPITIEIKVNDFLDMDSYIFTKTENIFVPFKIKR